MEKVGKGGEIAAFLKTFEGAAATFSQEDSMWSLWLPEVTAGDRPITPASQLYFAVILRHDQQAFAIRFFYDCSTGKVRYYTSALPEEIAIAPEFENAVSELFRHTLPVEPIRQRKLRRLPRRNRFRRDSKAPESVTPQIRDVPTEMADPVEIEKTPPIESKQQVSPVDPVKVVVHEPKVNEPTVKKDIVEQPEPQSHPEVTKAEPLKKAAREPVRMIAKLERAQPSSAPEEEPKADNGEWERNDSRALSIPPPRSIEVAPRSLVPSMDDARQSPADFEGVRKVQFDVGERMRSVLMAIIVVCGIVSGLGIVAYTYMVMNEDPGVKHHRLQNQLVESQRGR